MQKDGIFGKFIAETTSIDYKVTLEETKPKSWLKSVCAFANGNRRYARFWNRTTKGHLVGLDDPQHVAEKASELINARIDPTPPFRLEAVEEDDCRIVLLRVGPGDDCPYVYVGDGSQIRIRTIRKPIAARLLRPAQELVHAGITYPFRRDRNRISQRRLQFRDFEGFVLRTYGGSLGRHRLRFIRPRQVRRPPYQGRVPNRGVSGPSPENRRHPCEVNLSLRPPSGQWRSL